MNLIIILTSYIITYNNIYINYISSVESQKGATTIQRRSIENQKGAITIDFVQR